MSPLRLLLAEDHALVRDGLKALIAMQPDMEVVGEAANGRDALKQAIALRPDVVLLDIAMPGMNGVEVTEHLTRECPGTKVLGLTALEDRRYVRRILKAGAAGYITKSAASERLIEAIRTVAAGKTYIDPTVAGDVIKNMLQTSSPPDEAQDHSALTPREEEVLKMVAWGLSYKEIGAKLGLSVKTVDTHKSRAMQKLGLHSRAEIVRYAIRHGWLHDPNDMPSP